MPRRDPAEARLLGLWTAGWLFALLIAGIVWIGDLGVQWPVLAVPLLWALAAARPRRRPGPARPDRLDDWPPPVGVPPTRELPASRPLPRPPGSRRS